MQRHPSTVPESSVVLTGAANVHTVVSPRIRLTSAADVSDAHDLVDEDV